MFYINKVSLISIKNLSVMTTISRIQHSRARTEDNELISKANFLLFYKNNNKIQ